MLFDVQLINNVKLLMNQNINFHYYQIIINIFSTIDLGFSTTLKPNYNPNLGHYDSLSEIALKNEFAKKILNIYSINNN